MSGLRITLDDAKSAIKTLSIPFTFPKDTTVDELALVWVDAFRDVEPGELRHAVKAYIRDEQSYFPRNPGKLRKLALDYRRWVISNNGPPPKAPIDESVQCSVCGAKIQSLPPEDQVLERWVEGVKQNVRAPAKAPRLGILHNLELDHEGKPVEYGYIPQKRSKQTVGAQ